MKNARKLRWLISCCQIVTAEHLSFNIQVYRGIKQFCLHKSKSNYISSITAPLLIIYLPQFANYSCVTAVRNMKVLTDDHLPLALPCCSRLLKNRWRNSHNWVSEITLHSKITPAKALKMPKTDTNGGYEIDRNASLSSIRWCFFPQIKSIH